MAIDPMVIGRELPPVTMVVDAGRLRLYAKAIGETGAVHTGDRPPVPPTFLFGLEMEQSDPFAWLADLGVDLRRVLHGEQSFTYHSMAYAGETLVAKPRIADVYAKKGGALDFVVKETAVSTADGRRVADLTSVIVVRNPVVAR
jgi:hypothetical protein